MLASALGGAVGSVGAAPLTTDGPTAAGYAGRWLAAQVAPAGFVPDANGDPSPGATLATSLALATAGVDPATFDRTVAWLAGHVDDVTMPYGDVDPGQVGYLIMVGAAAGADPHSFGGVDLVTRLDSTLGAFEPGLYGVADPTYDGAFRQGVAILGLEAATAVVPAAASDWLISQQCGTGDPTIRGAWMAYRAPAQVCVAGDPATYTGVDTNSTAMASEALSTLGLSPTYDPFGYFDAVQNSTGGWGYLAGTDDDPNSDALVIQALVAAGLSPVATPWVEASGTPLSSLLGFQLGCDADPADQGAFTFPGTGGTPNALATPQSVWGAMARSFPLTDVTFVAAPTPCLVPGTGSTSTDVTVFAQSVAATASPTEPISAAPAFTG